MHVLANWIAQLVQFLYCSIIYHTDCNSGPFCACKWTFLCSLVDLFVHSSGPFGGPFSDWGGGGFFRAQRTPLATALVSYSQNKTTVYTLSCR